MDTPFGASDQQEADASPGTAAVDRNSTIDEAAEDIAEAWRKAPQPRRDAHRHSHRADEQGPPCQEWFALLDVKPLSLSWMLLKSGAA